MRGVTPDGKVIKLNSLQEYLVQGVRAWALGQGTLQLPYIGRQSGKTVILATVAEYDKRGWPDDLPEDLSAPFWYDGDEGEARHWRSGSP